MKRLLLIFFVLLSSIAYAQHLPEYGLNKVRIAKPDKTIVAEIDPVDNPPKIKPDLFYYWYGANLIHSTQGGFSGRLLNGLYNEYYLNKNLKEQGRFKKGLKDGVWKDWKEDGTTEQVTNWKNGVLITGKPVPIWKRINIFKKKAPKDTITKQPK